MDINEIGLAKVSLPPDFVVRYHNLANLEPEKVKDVTGTSLNMPVWHAFFDQDLLQAVSAERSLFLDVGWYPSFDPVGRFVAKVYPWELTGTCRATNWSVEIASFETRSLGLLLQYFESCGFIKS